MEYCIQLIKKDKTISREYKFPEGDFPRQRNKLMSLNQSGMLPGIAKINVFQVILAEEINLAE